MHLEKWEKFFRIHLPFISPTASLNPAHEARLPYRVVTVCRAADRAMVEQLIRQQLLNTCVVQYHCGEPDGTSNLTSITVEMLCTISERANVVQLVTRLGLEKSVRSVRWESMPHNLVA
ncbi:hypothetical protein [Glaciimonas immobilis]|uniref:Putative membrane protein YhiD involved in acid resistance n=1 Tax=Glaciimonas immobilis TaxID=728004 RepID=A0A840RPB7_9BURK|nr:hypothetical protein [Glaciimonas immobilis]KAF3998951.1 hypothetical protein HAV38_03035 [Glaciimonas immobilis]MBB5198359.1 putative membrane protein YhiD involved in acid resistance [Glaciimonas immobilis]